MNRIGRRTFLTSAVAAGALMTKGARGAMGTGKKRACIIADSKRGGYGHDIHLTWAMRDDVEVVALADPDETGRLKHAKEARAERTYADYREMLDKERPDLVSICPRWTVNHREYLLAVAEAGAHGFIEKPIATDLAEADDMVRAIEAKDLKWVIAHNFRATDALQHTKRLVIDEGIIGDILELRARGKEDSRAGGEDLIVLGTHVFDYLIFLMGKPSSCVSDITVDGRRATKSDVRDATEPLGPVVGDRIQATFAFDGGVNGYFSTMKNSDGNGGRWGVDIFGSKGAVTVRMSTIPDIFLLREPSWVSGGDNAAWERLPGVPEGEIRSPRVRHAPMTQDLLDAIEADREPQYSLQSGRDAYEMIQAIFESHVESRRVELPLENRTHPLKRWA